MYTVCTAKMCKTEMKNLDKDKTFIDLLKRMTDITNKLMEIRFKKTPHQ